jgi:hypothetical protein
MEMAWEEMMVVDQLVVQVHDENMLNDDDDDDDLYV